MKTKLLLTFCFTFLNLIIQAQSTFTWADAKSAGGVKTDDGFSIAADLAGNIYVAGQFQSPTITFGTVTLTNYTNTGTSYDIFLVKYDPAGNVAWAMSMGGSGGDGALHLCADANGNVVIAGYYGSSTIAFGTTTLTNAGRNDMFIVKYNTAGNLLWAKGAGGSSYDDAKSVSMDAAGNILMSGVFQSPSIAFGTTTLTGTGVNFCLVKFDASGNVLWGRNGGGAPQDIINSISTDVNGNVFILGDFDQATLTIGSTTLTNVSNVNNTDIFFAKYDASGNPVWAKSVGGSANDFGFGITTDPSGNVFLTGYFQSPSITVGSVTITNASGTECFIAKYDPAGNMIWAKPVASTFGTLVKADVSGNFYLAGIFSSTAGLAFGSTTLTSTGASDLFIAKYDAAGNAINAISASGGGSQNLIDDLCIDASGAVYVTGSFQSSSLVFGNITLMNASSTGTIDDVFIAKMTDASTTTGIQQQSKPVSFQLFPNPFSSQLTFNTGAALYNAVLLIDNVQAQNVRQIDKINLEANQSLIIPRGDLPAGLYFLRLMQDGKTMGVEKILISD